MPEDWLILRFRHNNWLDNNVDDDEGALAVVTSILDLPANKGFRKTLNKPIRSLLSTSLALPFQIVLIVCVFVVHCDEVLLVLVVLSILRVLPCDIQHKKGY